MFARRDQKQDAIVFLRLSQLPEPKEIVRIGFDFLAAKALDRGHDQLNSRLILERGELCLETGFDAGIQHARLIHDAPGQRRKRIVGEGHGRKQQPEQKRQPGEESRNRRHRRGPSQNFTFGAVCASSAAVNSAIGLLDRKAVDAQRTPGKVRSSTL